MVEIPKDWRLVRGNTYIVREELKALGALWDPDTRAWYVSPEDLKEAEEIIELEKSSRRRY